MLQVSALYVYPIKSCSGISVSSARVEARGLEFDRRYMLVDDNGRFLTQRQIPRMALLQTSIGGSELLVSRPDGSVLTLPLRPSFRDSARVRVWRSELDADVAGADVNAWFSEYLDRPTRLVYMADHQHRRVAAQRATRPDDEVSFADGAPVLLISEGSLADLNERLGAPVSMLRFRPNIVVNASAAFIEDTWRRIRISDTEFEVAWPCSRCTIPTVDPASGAVDDHGEPLATLRAYRRDGAGVFFGQNLLTRGAGIVNVGDSIELPD